MACLQAGKVTRLNISNPLWSTCLPSVERTQNKANWWWARLRRLLFMNSKKSTLRKISPTSRQETKLLIFAPVLAAHQKWPFLQLWLKMASFIWEATICVSSHQARKPLGNWLLRTRNVRLRAIRSRFKSCNSKKALKTIPRLKRCSPIEIKKKAQ